MKNRFHGPPRSQMVLKKTTVIGQAGPPSCGGGPDYYPSVLLNGNQISASTIGDGINGH